MRNMSYCRFQNTLKDLRDCEEALEDGFAELSPDERRAAVNLIRVAMRICKEWSNADELRDDFPPGARPKDLTGCDI